jgi:hypothetical protein
MPRILVALALGVAVLLAIATAFAGEAGSDQDHGTLVVNTIQTEPIQLGTLSGPDHTWFAPYFELRQENSGK